MRRRIVACLIGGLVGVSVSGPVSDSLGISQTVGLLACGMAGLAIGYVASTLVDVFLPTSQGDVQG
jgi:hypothetical protein